MKREMNKTLNPKLFNTSTNYLLPEVKDKLLSIIKAFTKFLDIPIEIADVQLVGSNAAYNYTEHSDLDLHIIANYEAILVNQEILQSAYYAEQSAFNKKYDISIKGINVELYVQDIKSGIKSNGIYSVIQNEWVKKPVKQIVVNEVDNSEAVSKWKASIDKAVKKEDEAQLKQLLNNIYLVRHNSIAVDGEYGKGNLLFKEIRNLGYLDKLKEALDKAMSKKLSLEGLSIGQLVTKM